MIDRQVVFIGGLHRSGTSLLFRCLRDHPDISGFQNTGVSEDEGHYLQSVYAPTWRHGGPGRFGFDPNAHLTENSPLATSENACRLFMDWAPYWDLRKPWLLEKTPANLLRTRFLQTMFPAARFVIIMRHPVAVSLATQKWRDVAIRSLLDHWIVCHEVFADDAKRLNHVLVIKYEDLLASPNDTLRQVYEFIGVDVLPATQAVDDAPQRRYQEQWSTLMQKGTETPTPTDNHFHLERRLTRFGYSLRWDLK